MKDMNIKVEEYKTKRDRIKALDRMHETMLSMNNEMAYDQWIYTMPDQPSYDDYEDIANDEDMFKECIEEFNNIFNMYKSDGLYKPSYECIELMQKYHMTIEVFF